MLAKDTKLITLSLLLRSMPSEKQSLLMSHFNSDLQRALRRIQMESSLEQNMDWAAVSQSVPALRKILNECLEEARLQKLAKAAEEQRPQLKQYILMKLGKHKKGGPVFLSQDITKVIDKYITSYHA